MIEYCYIKCYKYSKKKISMQTVKIKCSQSTNRLVSFMCYRETLLRRLWRATTWTLTRPWVSSLHLFNNTSSDFVSLMNSSFIFPPVCSQAPCWRRRRTWTSGAWACPITATAWTSPWCVGPLHSPKTPLTATPFSTRWDVRLNVHTNCWCLLQREDHRSRTHRHSCW